MPTIALRTTAPASTHVKWLKPEPLWASPESEMTRPFVAEFTTDSFLPDFLAMMGGSLPIALQKPQSTVTKQSTDGTSIELMKLYQPIHHRYYLVTGSLVCRQSGLPDHTVVAKNGEKTSFVLRRSINGAEYGWVNDRPNKGWQPLVDTQNRPVLIRKDEQRLPLHPVKTCASTPQGGAKTGAGRATCNQRNVYYGYIPVDARERYLLTEQSTALAQDTAARLIEIWRGLYYDPMKSQISQLPSDQALEQLQRISLYMLLDLGNLLKTNLPDLFKAITSGNRLDGPPKSKALFDELGRIFVDATNSTEQISLVQALRELKDFLRLLYRPDDEPPATKYNVYGAILHYEATNPLIAPGAGSFRDPANTSTVYAPIDRSPPVDTYLIPITATYVTDANHPEKGRLYLAEDGILANLIKDALAEGGTLVQVPHSEAVGLMKSEMVDENVYYLRLVYEYGDGCVVVSDPSLPFIFAEYSDAPG